MTDTPGEEIDETQSGSRPKPAWLGPRFATDRARNTAVRELMQSELTDAIEHGDTSVIDSAPFPRGLLDGLIAPLLDPDEPRASAAAESAFVLLAFCIAEGRVLRLVPPSQDLRKSRVSGDRATSESLSVMLSRHRIPATEGALQSNTYRSGYLAPQARNSGLAQFVEWVGEANRTLDDLRSLFHLLAQVFARLKLSFPDLPALDAEAFTFARTRTLIDRLRAVGSGGAFEQYLVAAFLAEEFAVIHPSWRVVTKRVGAADAGTRAAGDVEIRRRQALVYAIEVSAETWLSKVRQAGKAAARSSNRQVTIVAPAFRVTGDQLEAGITDGDVPPGVDIAVVDLDSFLDVTSSRLTAVARRAAIRRAYADLVTWGRTRPDLVAHFVSTVRELGLTADREGAAEDVEGLSESIDKLRAFAELDDDPVVQVARDDLTAVLVWIEQQLNL